MQELKTFEASLAQADHDFFMKIVDINHCANCILAPANTGILTL